MKLRKPAIAMETGTFILLSLGSALAAVAL
jgi:hypothetical protein